MTAVEAAALGEIIKQARIATGMSQRAFAKTLDVTQGAVSAWETGTGRPDVSRFDAIASALGIDVGALTRAAAAQS